MGLFEIAAVLIVLTALFSYANYRTLGLPTTIGVMVISMLVSLGVAGMGLFGLGAVQRQSAKILGGIDFNKALLHGMLSFLLFAGALHIKLEGGAIGAEMGSRATGDGGRGGLDVHRRGVLLAAPHKPGHTDPLHPLPALRRPHLPHRSGRRPRDSENRRDPEEPGNVRRQEEWQFSGPDLSYGRPPLQFQRLIVTHSLNPHRLHEEYSDRGPHRLQTPRKQRPFSG